MPKLKRQLGLVSTTLYGIGVILGAGIYALIGVGAGLAGNALWLAFLIAAIISVFTALSYAELSGMFPKDAAEYTYTRKASGRESLAFIVGWLLVLGAVIGSTAVSLGFASYFSVLFGGTIPMVAAALIVLMTLLNYIGIKESSWYNDISSLIEVGGLLIVIALVFMFPPKIQVDLFELPSTGFAGIMAAVSVIFFAYIGFENVANISEEVKSSKTVVPKAIIISIVVSTILYMLVSIAAIQELGWEALAHSKAPLADVVARAIGPYAVSLSVIALFATSNTVLIMLIAASRILYGMAEGGSLPKFFSKLSSHGTPTFSVLLLGFFAAAIALYFPLKTVAELTDLSTFIAYAAVNLSLIALASSKIKRSFTSPRFFGIPILAWIGALSNIVMFVYFKPEVWLMELAVILVGVVLFLFGRSSRKD